MSFRLGPATEATAGVSRAEKEKGCPQFSKENVFASLSLYSVRVPNQQSGLSVLFGVMVTLYIPADLGTLCRPGGP